MFNFLATPASETYVDHVFFAGCLITVIRKQDDELVELENIKYITFLLG